MPRPLILTALAATSLLLAVSPALAGGRNSSSIALVMGSDTTTLSTATAGGPSYGDHVTFAVSTTATDRPYVTLNCHQGTNWVYAAQAGFWTGYPGGQDFNLAASSWPGGAADCTATLGVLNADGTKFRALATTTFHVAA